MNAMTTVRIADARRSGHLDLSGIPLSGDDLKELDEAVPDLAGGIRTVSLAGCGLTVFPGFIARCSQMQMLWVYGNKITEVPDIWSSLPELTLLDLSGNPIAALPGIEYAEALQKLYLNDTAFAKIPEEWTKLVRLDTLEMQQHRLAQRDAGISFLPSSLKELRITRGILGPDPVTFKHLMHLESLELSNNALIEIETGNLASLRLLDVSNNMLQHLPADMDQLVLLEYLDVSSNDLESLPEGAGACPLGTAMFRNNRVKRMPDTVPGWKAMTTLDLDYNALSALPDYSGQMPELSAVNCARNLFTAMPDWLGKCPRLYFVSFAGNPLSSIPAWVVEQDRKCDLSDTMITAREIKALQERDIRHEVELIIRNTPAAQQPETFKNDNHNIRFTV